MIHGWLPAFRTIVCAESVGPAVALFSGLLPSSLSSHASSSSSSTVAIIPLWFLIRLVLLILVLWLVWRWLLIGSLVVGLVRGWGGADGKDQGRV